MPALGSGVTCSPGARGTFAWLSTATPTKTGVVAAGLDPIRHLVATDASCVTESACQAYCLGDKACTYYAYDASGAAGSAGATTCPTAGAVCTTFSGGLPAQITTGPTPYVSGGIPATRLGSRYGSRYGAGEAFVPCAGPPYQSTDACGNFGAARCRPECGRSGEAFVPCAGPPYRGTDACGNFGAARRRPS